MKNYFAFIDESGNLKSEDFFGLGMLLVENVGELYDGIKIYYHKVKEISRLQKEKTIKDYLANKKYEDLAKIAASSQAFELKFKYVNFTNNSIYRDLIGQYFTHADCRFACAVIDRKDPKFQPEKLYANPWEMYLSYAATLIAGTMSNLPSCNICVLADDLTKPRTIKTTFENALTAKIQHKLKQDGINRNIFSVARLESHSSLMLQVVDILLGAVMFDFKKARGLISSKLLERQEPVVEKIQRLLKVKTLAGHFTVHKPSYFNVWPMKWK